MKKISRHLPSSVLPSSVLFAVTGMSPAILTETAWLLARAGAVPDRVVALTTLRGAAQIERELLSGRPSVWESLRLALGIKDCRLQFEPARVFTIPDPATGRASPLEDIRTQEENAAVADFILEQLRAFVENPQIRVVASIAGGRKTMSALLYACMSLIGRETDRLTHVLVGEPYDDPRLNPRFYYPEQTAQALSLPGLGKPVRARDARIELADIPFVPLRNRFAELAEKPGHFHQLVLRYSKELKRGVAEPVSVQLHLEEDRVTIDGKPVELRKKALLVLEFLLRINRDESRPPGQIEAEAPFREFLAAHSDAVAREWASTFAIDDLKRELSAIRKQFDRLDIVWKPGLRKDSLKLPPFKYLSGDR